VYQFRVFNPGLQRFAQQFVDKGAGYQYALINIEVELALPCLMGQIGYWYFFFCPAFDQINNILDLGGQ